MGQAGGARFEALIIGAGPAGSAAAIGLARAGWALALVERQRFPRRKVCGECIAAGNLPLLQRLGVGADFEASAGPALRQVTLWRSSQSVTAALPAADHGHGHHDQPLGDSHGHPGDAVPDHRPNHRPGPGQCGRALGRERLDTLLLEQARSVGVEVLQPWSVQAIKGVAGAWHCELHDVEATAIRRVRATLVIDAHGSQETRQF